MSCGFIRISGALESVSSNNSVAELTDHDCRELRGRRLRSTYTSAEGSSRPVSSTWASIIFRIRAESVTVKVRIITPTRAACSSTTDEGDPKLL